MDNIRLISGHVLCRIANKNIAGSVMFILIFCNFVASVCAKNMTSGSVQKDLLIYKNLFKLKRKEHIVAIQKIILIEDISHKASMIDIMLETMIKTISTAIDALEYNQYNLTSRDFPTEEVTKDDLSKVLENTALFTDVVVRFPYIAQIAYKKNKNKWKKQMSRAIGICDGSPVYDGDYKLLLHNLRQELQIGEYDENYHNPFKTAKQDQGVFMSTEERKALYKEAKKQKKKKKQTGPKLSVRSDL